MIWSRANNNSPESPDSYSLKQDKFVPKPNEKSVLSPWLLVDSVWPCGFRGGGGGRSDLLPSELTMPPEGPVTFFRGSPRTQRGVDGKSVEERGRLAATDLLPGYYLQGL